LFGSTNENKLDVKLTCFCWRELWKKGQDINLEFDRISWDEEISIYEAHQQIDLTFYPFKKVSGFE